QHLRLAGTLRLRQHRRLLHPAPAGVELLIDRRHDTTRAGRLADPTPDHALVDHQPLCGGTSPGKQRGGHDLVTTITGPPPNRARSQSRVRAGSSTTGDTVPSSPVT